MWQKAKIRHAMLREAALLGRYVWVKAEAPHEIQHLEPDGTGAGPGRRAQMYDTNVKSPHGERGCHGIQRNWVELMPEFREHVKMVSYEQWMTGTNGDENV